MKSERRHELEQNELADWLGDFLVTVKPYLNTILAAVVAVVLVTVGYAWWVRHAEANAANSWNDFFAAMGTGEITDFDKVAEDHPGTQVAQWARVISADLHLNLGCDQLFKSRVAAQDELRQAVEGYLAVLETSRVSEIRQRATYGLARAYESQGNLDKAAQSYNDLKRNWPEGAFATAAERRLEDIKSPATEKFYDRFATFNPRPSASEGSGAADQRPAFDLNSLPELKKDSQEPPFVLPSLELEEDKTDTANQPDESSEAETEKPKEPAEPKTEKK